MMMVEIQFVLFGLNILKENAYVIYKNEKKKKVCLV
jgi:hypothetical protein